MPKKHRSTLRNAGFDDCLGAQISNSRHCRDVLDEINEILVFGIGCDMFSPTVPALLQRGIGKIGSLCCRLHSSLHVLLILLLLQYTIIFIHIPFYRLYR